MIQYFFIRHNISAEKATETLLRTISIFILTLYLLNLPALAQGQYPVYTAHINDFANVIDPTTENQLETILLNFENRSGTQIGVAIITTLGGRSIEEYANGLYRAWGIGAKSGPNKDKGALLLIATQDRQSRLEVGYGLEGDLPDGLAGEMLRRMRPYFQQQQWSQGVTVGVRTIVDTLAQKWNLSLEGIDRRYAYSPGQSGQSASRGTGRGQTEGKGNWGNIFVFILLVVFIIIFVIGRIRKRFGGSGRGYHRRGGLWGGPMIFHNGGSSFGGGSVDNGSSDWGGGSSGSDSGSSSGSSDWGGFDGGSSGGGGASDSW